MRLLLVIGCTACINSFTGEDRDVAVTLVEPAPNSQWVATDVSPDGYLVAAVPLRWDVGGAVDAVRVLYDGHVRAEGATLPDTVLLPPRDAQLVVQALIGGDVVAESSVQVAVTWPEAACPEVLSMHGIDVAQGPAAHGVAMPVTVSTPVGGLRYRVNWLDEPRESMFADCNLIASLLRAAPYLHERDVVEVRDLGIYNYRCIGEGTPPDCNLSQHSFATAIDLAGFVRADGSLASVASDWVITEEDACAAPGEPGKDAFLHELICTLKAANVWNIVLTPNYNAAHRDHFHVDLTPDADFMERLAHENE